MARRAVQRRQEFSFTSGGSSAARGAEEKAERRGLPPRVPTVAANPMAPRAGEEEFRWLQAASRPGSPESGAGYDQRHMLYPASAGSSPSRAQAIAGYRREMLDLVRGLPEAAYELSLRDIVESRPSPLPPPPPPPPPNGKESDGPEKPAAAAAMDDDEEDAKKQSGGKKQGKAVARKQRTMGRTRSRSMERSVSLDTGLLIKLFMPLSVGRKKKVSPKPAAAKDGKKTKKKAKQGKGEEEWWKKSEFSEAGSSSRTSSSGSSNRSASTNGNGSGSGNGGSNPRAPARSRSRKRIGCYGFFRADKRKNRVIRE